MAPGHSCCMLNCTNASHTYTGEKKQDGIRFFRIPKVQTHQGKLFEELTVRRRRAWVAAIRRTTITFESSSEGMRVCSRHFHEGKPAYHMMESHPDWAPSLHLGHEEIKATDSSRHNRQKNRARRKQEAFECACETEESVHLDAVCENADMDTGDSAMSSGHEIGGMGLQTEMTGEDIDGMRQEINGLLEENRCLREQIACQEITQASLEGDNDKVQFYTGLPNFATLMVLLNYLMPHLPQGGRRQLSPFQLLMVCFMRLRLNLPMQHIAYYFGVHKTSASNAFMETLSVMYTQLKSYVRWPDRETWRVTTPHKFVETFGKKVAVIIDCFEIFTERPSNVHAKAVTFSHYKHNNTMKYLIGITPNGLISFISKGWGGQTTDRHITDNSGFLDNLLPGDLVLADRGFDISDSVGLMCAEVKIPAFTRGKCQMHAKSIEDTRKLAHLRIHVEQVIGNLSGKYKIITDVIPIKMILPCEGEDLTFLDKIVRVCCALTNMSASVV